MRGDAPYGDAAEGGRGLGVAKDMVDNIRAVFARAEGSMCVVWCLAELFLEAADGMACVVSKRLCAVCGLGVCAVVSSLCAVCGLCGLHKDVAGTACAVRCKRRPEVDRRGVYVLLLDRPTTADTWLESLSVQVVLALFALGFFFELCACFSCCLRARRASTILFFFGVCLFVRQCVI